MIKPVKKGNMYHLIHSVTGKTLGFRQNLHDANLAAIILQHSHCMGIKK